MATLVLGTVGRVLGGPLGGIVGTLLGGTIDRGLFGGGTVREGPRLANLAVQSAAYGEPLPRVYGRMRVAGNLVWTAGIKESRQRTGGGKSGTATNTYSYSASFAVIVAARPIVGVERIWADGKLLRAADGTLHFPAIIRTYCGTEDQAVDPLIAAAEGSNLAPAYRGRALVVFEDLPLADYGNRIPNLTFEVVADTGKVGLDAIAVDIGGGLVAAGDGSFPAVTGFAAAQAGSMRQVLTTLGVIADLALRDDGTCLHLGAGQAAASIDATDAGATDSGTTGFERRETRAGEAAVPDAVWLSYSDPARDYQAGVQAATRRTPAVRIDHRDLGIAVDASGAKALAERALRRAIAARATAKHTLPWRYATVRPGDLLLTGGDPCPWRVTHRTLTGATIEVDLERTVADGGVATPVADAGRAYIGSDAPQGETILHILDLPALPGPVATTPLLLLAASGTRAGWRRADVMISRDGGASYAVAASIGAPATTGTATTLLAPGATARWDRLSTLDVELATDDADLQSATEAAVLAGANFAVVGDEIIQFATAVATGPRRFRLSTFLRGCRGSEEAVARHGVGERFVLLDDRVATLALPAEALGTPLVFKAVGLADALAAVSARTVVPHGINLRPLSPATISITAIANGDRVVTWRRRSRAGFAWTDGTDAPLAEDNELYRLSICDGEAVLRTVDVTVPTWTYPAAAAAADRAAAVSPPTLAVAQVSAFVGPGPATIVRLS